MKVAVLIPIVVIVLTTVTVSPGNAYEFYCYDGDSCGACTVDNATRWVPSQVPFYFDMEIVHPNLTQEEWVDVITKTLDAFNSVSGSTLYLENAGQAPKRDYGGSPDYHEVFWILSWTEWFSSTGLIGTNTLGVSWVKYDCGEPRLIYDADYVMNGTASFNWQYECNGSGCRNVQHTLMHELGHCIGLGHACESCDWSIMAEFSGTNQMTELLEDDQNGIRALYPGELGQLGAECLTDAQCAQGLCITAGLLSYCSQTCAPGTCPDGYVCLDLEGQVVCTFAEGPGALCVGSGENCSNRCCENGLVCTIDGDESTCLTICNPDDGDACPANEVCVLLEDASASVCLPQGTTPKGGACEQAYQCAPELVCVVAEGEGAGICVGICDDTGCDYSEYCYTLAAGESVCMPRGTADKGDACPQLWDCFPGLDCVQGICQAPDPPQPDPSDADVAIPDAGQHDTAVEGDEGMPVPPPDSTIPTEDQYDTGSSSEAETIFDQSSTMDEGAPNLSGRTNGGGGCNLIGLQSPVSPWEGVLLILVCIMVVRRFYSSDLFSWRV